MGEQLKKQHISAGLLAHVGASRRAPNKMLPDCIQNAVSEEILSGCVFEVKTFVHCARIFASIRRLFLSNLLD
jgi:hypothetical protein